MELERRAEEANAMGRRYGVSLFFEMMGEISRGVALSSHHQPSPAGEAASTPSSASK
jgi:hypothetical protein